MGADAREICRSRAGTPGLSGGVDVCRRRRPRDVARQRVRTVEAGERGRSRRRRRTDRRSRRARREGWTVTTALTPANQLTLLRMLLIPAFVILVIYGHLGWALVVFVTAGITDALDGLIARWS